MTNLDQSTKELIENNPISLATINEDNTPNVIGVAFAKVVSDNQIIITDNYMSQTKNNIVRNNNVCLAVWDADWCGKKIVATAEYLTTGEWKSFVEKLPENKGLSAKGAILVTVSKIINLC